LNRNHIFYNKEKFKENAINLLFDMKRTGDWGQASWVYQTNLANASRRPPLRVVFESGDRLAALYSIYLNNPTVFGGRKIGGLQSSLFGIYNPLIIERGQKRRREENKIEDDLVRKRQKGRGITSFSDIQPLLNMYASTDTIRECINHISSLNDTEDFLTQNIVHFASVASEIFKASSKILPEPIKAAWKYETVSRQNEEMYKICVMWLQNEKAHTINNLEMFEVTNFILHYMSSILRKTILDESEELLSTSEDSLIVAWRKWIESLYPYEFNFSKSKSTSENVARFETHEKNLANLWKNVYQHMYPEEVFEEDEDE
jgi:hypothetical protein